MSPSRSTGAAVRALAGSARVAVTLAAVGPDVPTQVRAVAEVHVRDPLRVRGVGRLRVVDTSIMPTIVSGNTNAPAMAIGLRAADLIRADR